MLTANSSNVWELTILTKQTKRPHHDKFRIYYNKTKKTGTFCVVFEYRYSLLVMLVTTEGISCLRARVCVCVRLTGQ